MTASQILDLIAPQYMADPNKASFIILARGQTSLCFYGTNYERAVALRTAHMLALRDAAQSGAGGGEVASKREGDLAIAYHKSTIGDGDSDLVLTIYGKQLMGLTAGSGPVIGVTGGNDDGCA